MQTLPHISPQTPVLIAGPTASGKTDLALELARLLPCELVSVDSALVYRGMDIGTAKPEPGVLAEFPHRLIDIREPEQSYSAAEFRSDALAAMAEITACGRIPLLVGGTMLYFRALLDGLAGLNRIRSGTPGADEAAISGGRAGRAGESSSSILTSTNAFELTSSRRRRSARTSDWQPSRAIRC